MKEITFIDLFCGLGGIRTALEHSLATHHLKGTCLLSSDIKKYAISTYKINYQEEVFGDITQFDTHSIDYFDILLAGFPCQSFSTAGSRKGFEDTRGTLFFEVARILHDKKPKAFLLENVEGLVSHDKGNTLKVIIQTLKDLGYSTSYKVLNSADFGSAQNRKRIYIVGTLSPTHIEDVFNFNIPYNKKKFKDIREYQIPVSSGKLNTILLQHFTDLHFLQGKSITDKRGGKNNIHSWDLALKGQISNRQKNLINLIVTKRRLKKWAVENGTAWFDGIPLSFQQIQTFIDYPELQEDLDFLVSLGYLKCDYPKDFRTVLHKKEKISRTDLPLGYTLTTGKLSFEFNKILDDNSTLPTIVATDASRFGVLEINGLRKLTHLELKRLFGFPEHYITAHLKESELFDLFGNSVSIHVVEAITDNLIQLLKNQHLI